MSNNSDRRSITSFAGYSTSSVVWNKPATEIPVPRNGPRRWQDRAPTTTVSRNIYNGPTRKSNPSMKPVGNSTSRRLSEPGPPTKRQRLDNNHASVSHPGHSYPRNKRDLPPDEDVASPDELNLFSPQPTTRTSKYEFASTTRPGSSTRPYIIAEDGKAFKEIAAIFSSDPIEQFPLDDPLVLANTEGRVSRAVREFEREGDNESHPKIDLVHEQRNRSRRSGMKGKTKVPSSLVTLESILPTVQLSKNGDLMMRPVQTNKDQQDNHIPVVECYNNQEHVVSIPVQKLGMAIENQELCLWDRRQVYFRHPISDYTIAHAGPLNVGVQPVIQFQPPNFMTMSTITIRLGTREPEWDSRNYSKFLGVLKKLGVKEAILRQTQSLWQTAKQNASITGGDGESHAAGTDKQTSRQRTRSQDLREILHQRKEPDLGPAPPSTRTNPLKRKAESESSSNQVVTIRPLEMQVSTGDPKAISQARSSKPSGPKPVQRNLRSRTRAEVDREVENVEQEVENPDEVVLSYPAGLPGAVNITNFDLIRLKPGAFLNDTLIEFGLKVWLKDLEASNPELASQIHVFSSFFYKKLNSKKDLQAAYESVRKWTSKIDIFQKKYIVVPINEHLHWYLAIIYEPEHILKTQHHNQPPRIQTRQSTIHNVSESNSPGDSHTGTPVEESDRHSEAEVEHDLKDFQSSCNITDHDTMLSPKPDDHSDIYGDEPVSPSRDIVMNSPNQQSINLDFPRLSPTVSDCETSTNQRQLNEDLAETVEPSVSTRRSERTSSVVDAARFYQPAARQYGKRKRTQDQPSLPLMDVDADEVEIIEHTPKTYIFTFDSLGSRHPQATKKLSNYLRLEAKDKKGIDTPESPQGKSALVPRQMNFCDCGIYLLHFAQTFVSDATKYYNIILAQRPRSVSDEDRKAIWCVDKISEGRQNLQTRIQTLSKEWKKLRDGTKTQKPLEEVKKDDESEGEVELVESDSSKNTRATRKPHSRGQKTGPATRARG